MKRTLLILLLALPFHLLAGQALVLEDGRSGFDISTRFSTSKSSSKLYFGGGYIFNGRLNAGLDIGVLNLKEHDAVFTSVNSKIGYFCNPPEKREVLKVGFSD